MSGGERLRIGAIGTGGMGRHHVRILSSLPGAELVGVHDQNPDTAAAIAEQHGAEVFSQVDDLAAEAEALVLAVPTVDHAAVGCRMLEQGKHLLIEKPLAASLEEADRLLAAAADRVLAVGHVEFHNPAVEALLAVGLPPGFVEVQRLAPFTPRSLDVDVVLDLMIHDLQILHALDPSPLAEVRATGIQVLSPRIDIANVRIELASGCTANLTASRVSAEKVRKLRVFLPSHYYSVDYPAQEVKGYRLDHGADGPKIRPDDLPVVRREPLVRELEAFVAACRGEGPVGVSGAQGRRALATALAVVEAIGRQPGGG
jgi:predicted dehydrogenase